MSNLIAFGCSHTYGHGLPDCYSPPLRSGPVPSKFAWPNLLADKLGIGCINLSNPGSGNREIIDAVVNTKFSNNDLVLIMWSHFSRYDLFKYTKTQKIRGNQKEIREMCINNLFLKSEDWRYDNAVTNYFGIEFLNMWFEKNNINYFSIFALNEFQEFEPPSFFNKKKVITFPMSAYKVDLALDKRHFGLESHKLLAQEIYNKITA